MRKTQGAEVVAAEEAEAVEIEGGAEAAAVVTEIRMRPELWVNKHLLRRNFPPFLATCQTSSR
jgi:hypothetical protein